MKKSLTPKTALLSAVYVILLLVFITLLNIGLAWLFNNVIFDILNWFNKKGLFLKLILLCLGGVSLFYLILQLFSFIPIMLGILAGTFFPFNIFTVVSGAIISISNAIWLTIELWKIPSDYSFWIVIELLILTGFIFSINWAFIPQPKNDN
jgi:hypothetical protein